MLIAGEISRSFPETMRVCLWRWLKASHFGTLPELIKSMERLRQSTTRSQSAVYNKCMSGYKARLAAGKPERRVCEEQVRESADNINQRVLI